ncbi:unnamed protein product [Closterium sp. Naga37s-1]|nr:unnamed protein product [Closterium sp. Naga37s-1]
MTSSADPCVVTRLDCGPDASCVAYGDSPWCDCNDPNLFFKEADKTCFASALRTTVQLSGRNQPKQRLTLFTSAPAEQVSGTTRCAGVSASSGDTKITVMWDDPNVFGAGNGMCKSLSFYSALGCKGQPLLTMARPARKGRSYPATTRCVSVM